MNISESSIGNWTNLTSYNERNDVASGDQNSPNAYVWDLKWFALLAAPLLFGTIILPILLGPSIRFAFQTFLKLRPYWGYGSLLIAVVYLGFWLGLFFSPVEFGATFLNAITSVFLLLFVGFRAWRTWRLKRRYSRWLLYALFVILVILVDSMPALYASSYVPLPFLDAVFIFVLELLRYRRRKAAARKIAWRRCSSFSKLYLRPLYSEKWLSP